MKLFNISKTQISFFFILFINFLFLIKYGIRLTPFFVFLALGILGIYYLIWRKQTLIFNFKNERLLKISNPIMLLGFIGFSVLVFHFLPQEQLNVDRWSVISSFWDNFFEGKYVYFAKSHMGNHPGPMPFYFILALPFYFVGDLGYFSLIGLLVFYFILYYSKEFVRTRTLMLFLLLISAFYLWEVVTRSNIFTNSSLVLFSIFYFLKSNTDNNFKHLFINGLIIGLLLSTRNVFVIPYSILMLYLIKNKKIKFHKILTLALIVITTFALTFLPFIVNHFSDFLLLNPFVIQSSYLMPAWLSVFCIFASLGLYFFIRNTQDVYFYSGISLFFTISVYFIWEIYFYGFQSAYFGNKADISYFILCIPFFLYFLLQNPGQKTELTM